jgi:hypothetical protein
VVNLTCLQDITLWPCRMRGRSDSIADGESTGMRDSLASRKTSPECRKVTRQGTFEQPLKEVVRSGVRSRYGQRKKRVMVRVRERARCRQPSLATTVRRHRALQIKGSTANSVRVGQHARRALYRGSRLVVVARARGEAPNAGSRCRGRVSVPARLACVAEQLSCIGVELQPACLYGSCSSCGR